MQQQTFENITQWQNKTFPTATTESVLTKLQQECSELELSLLFGTVEEAKIEVADLFILLFDIANKLGIQYCDLDKIITAKMEVNKNRSWGLPNADGTQSHIK